MDERKSWEQMEEGESDLWYGRFRAYLLMGFKRSVQAVFQLEAEENRGNQRAEAHGYWYEYAKKYNWEERARAHDAHWIEEQDKLIAQEREVVLRTGYAQMHKRIEALNKLADKMVQWAEDDSKVWIVNTKTVTGENFSQHTEETVFNAPMMGMIEKYFTGIAAEKGERVKKKDITITEMPPNVYLDFDPDSDGTVTKEGDDGSEALPDDEL
jgi:hypothetical protein